MKENEDGTEPEWQLLPLRQLRQAQRCDPQGLLALPEAAVMTEQSELNKAENATFPPVPDDEVWCSIRGKLVGATECATDACVAPEMRPVCWLGKADGFLARDLLGDEQC